MPQESIMKLFLLVCVCAVSCELSGNMTESEKSTLVIGDPPPGQSTHRLIPAMIDSLDNSSRLFSPGNITDTTPFLPSGVIQSYRSSSLTPEESSPKSVNKDFTPSYFMGEVIPEPYVPERFQSARPMSDRNSPIGSHQGLVSSQTVTFPKLLPRDGQKKQKLPSYGQGTDDEHNSDKSLGSYFQGHVSPVHEPSVDGDQMTTPIYSPQFQESDQHPRNPVDTPYRFEKGYNSMQSTKPITFNDEPNQNQKPFSHDFEEDQGYFYPYNSYKVNADNFDEPFTSQPDYYKPSSGLKDDGRNSNYNSFGNIFSGPNDQTKHSYNSYPHFKDNTKHRPEVDLVLPSPFYPPELQHPSSHHKGVPYKVYQHKPKSALHGLLHFAAALLPLGLFVAALQPNVLHVNSSQPMPTKGRSVDSLGSPGLEVLERLERGDCERRAFCELAVLGSRPEANAAQRGLWLLAKSDPEDRTRSMGLRRTLTAVKSKSCSVLQCDSPPL